MEILRFQVRQQISIGLDDPYINSAYYILDGETNSVVEFLTAVETSQLDAPDGQGKSPHIDNYIS